MAWTEERVELLSKLWAEGLSASQIALELGGVTRNAVIGKVHRLKLSQRAKTTTTAKRSRKAPTPQSMAAPQRKSSGSGAPGGSTGGATVRVQTTTVGATALNAEVISEVTLDPRPVEEVVIPMSRRLKLVQLTELTCKWPIGDPINDEDFHFCGNDVAEGKPYCTAHCRVAFQPSSERRRLR